MLLGSLNDYTNHSKLENCLHLAHEKIKSLECLLASKDFVIFNMSVCNAFMAQSWKPPLPTCPPPTKECREAADDCSQVLNKVCNHSTSSRASS